MPPRDNKSRENKNSRSVWFFKNPLYGSFGFHEAFIGK